MAVTAVLETESLEFMIALIQIYVVCLHMSPQIPRRVLSAVDSDKTSLAVVSVHSEMIDPSKVAYEGNSDVEPDVSRRATCTHMLVGEELRRADRGTAVAGWLRPAGTVGKSSKRLIVASRSTSDVV